MVIFNIIKINHAPFDKLKLYPSQQTKPQSLENWNQPQHLKTRNLQI